MIFGPLFFFAPMVFSLITSLVGAALLLHLSRESFFTQSRLYTPLSHQKKNPTMAIGGVAIIAGIVAGLSFFIPRLTGVSFVLLGGILLFGAIGFFDDCVKRRNRIGISTKQKALLQCCASCIVLAIMYYVDPFFFSKSMFYTDSIWFYGLFLAWNLFIIVGTVNAVNLTDGLDMLAVLVVVPIAAFLLFVAYYQSNYTIALFIACLIGSLCGFAYFNKQPARLWMGDVGSLSIGSCIALSALLLSVELFLPLVGIVLVLETISVIIQVVSIRFFGKKFFKIAPLHHHFELCGYSESQIVRGFCFVSVLAALLGSVIFLLTIK